jgi:hypothetical protein
MFHRRYGADATDLAAILRIATLKRLLKTPGIAGLFIIKAGENGAVDGARTRDPRRDRPVL